MRTATSLLFVLPFCCSAQWIADNPVASVARESSGVRLNLQTGVLRLDVCSDSIVRVRYSPDGNFPEKLDNIVVKKDWTPVKFTLDEANSKTITLSTSRLTLIVTRADSTIAFRGTQGKVLLTDGPRKMWPITSNGEQTHRAEDVFKMYGSEEALYGLGQHQAGVWNYRGTSVELSQENTEIAIPMLLSTNGYGIFWNNTSVSKVNNRFIHYLYISSAVADTIDYYFFYGPDFDRIVADYRQLTGAAPMYGKWAYGYWQSKNKYKTEDEILAIAKGYRDRHIPIDNIVQDWFWWTHTGEFVFNKNYPDPKKMVEDLHQEHFHLMMSVWPFFDPGTETYADMDRRGFFIDRTKTESFHPKATALYDAFNPEARKYYWNLIDNALFKIGADAWWMDTTEPETEGVEENVLLSNKVGGMNGARVANLFPFETTSGVYQGQRAESNDKRVFILSRSAYAGIQRNGVTAWSGDVLSDWETYKRQIPAGLNFELSGVPYWTSDVGGFFIGRPRDPGYRELFVRWFQFATFCPIFRVHGTRAPDENELWSYGPEAEKILVDFDKLRYRLMPYIYSTAWRVTHESYTPMRPLVMDFAADPRTWNIGDEFLFGPSILVSPVTEQGAATRHLYLPAGTKWVDFWTGATVDGGHAVDAPALLDRIPIYLRAGSIVPMGEDIEYAAEKPDGPLEVRIYPGADADFNWYEDEGDNYNYEKGAYATVNLHWNDAQRELTIGDRKGSYAGMPQIRALHLVLVREGRGNGPEPVSQADQQVTYSGKQITLRMSAPR
jgi:alpha-D-xyloside xylohydrolase